MAHMIESTDSMFSVGETPWHGLGHVLDTAPATAADAMRAAGMAWTVSLAPLYAGDALSAVDSHRAVRRDDTGAVLGIVGREYTPLQNADAFTFFDGCVANGDATYHTAGTLRGNRVVWVLAKLGESWDVLPSDTVHPYVLLASSHDGSGAVKARFTPIRVVCNNTLTAALNGDAGRDRAISIRHTSGLPSRLAEAQRVMGLARRASARTCEAYRTLAQRQLKTAEIVDYIARVLPDNANAENHTRTTNMRAEIFSLIDAGLGADIPGVRGTLWSAYNAVTEYADHYRGVSPEKVLDNAARDSRLQSVWFGSGNALKETALEIALDVARAS